MLTWLHALVLTILCQPCISFYSNIHCVKCSLRNRKLSGVINSNSEPILYTWDVDDMTESELQEECRIRKLDTSGSKTALIARLLQLSESKVMIGSSNESAPRGFGVDNKVGVNRVNLPMDSKIQLPEFDVSLENDEEMEIFEGDIEDMFQAEDEDDDDEDEDEDEDDDDYEDVNTDSKELDGSDMDKSGLSRSDWLLQENEADMSIDFYGDSPVIPVVVNDFSDIEVIENTDEEEVLPQDDEQRQKRIRKLKKAIKLIEKLKETDYLKLNNDQRAKLKSESSVIEELGGLLIPGIDSPLEKVLSKIQPFGKKAIEYAAASLEDSKLKCVGCNKQFMFSARDQAFYAAKKFDSPVRCAACRQVKSDSFAAKEATKEKKVLKPMKIGSSKPRNKTNQSQKSK